jgi:tetratricopeptide (TPR) repeat protein
VFAAFSYLTRRPYPDALADVHQQVKNRSSTVRVRTQAVETLRAMARADSRRTKDVLPVLNAALAAGPKVVTDAAALAMNELGDDSGIAVVTASLDEEIETNPKNYTALYQRGEVFLRFGIWKQARRDFQDGLKLEKDPREPNRVHLGLARASAGLKQYKDAEKWLRRLIDTDYSALPDMYPEFRDMATDSRYGRLFEKD